MSFSLFNLQREHYEVKDTNQTVWLQDLNTEISCVMPKFELCCGSHLDNKSILTTSTGQTFEIPYVMHKVNTKNLPVWIKINYPDAVNEFSIASWTDIDDIPEDAFISLYTPNGPMDENWMTSPYTFFNSIIVDQVNKKIYLKKVIRKYIFTGEENWQEFQWGDNAYYCVLNVWREGSGRYEPLCTHAPKYSQNSSFCLDMLCTTQNKLDPMFFGVGTKFSTVEAFKAEIKRQYDNGTPITMWYIPSNGEPADVEERLTEIVDITETSPKLAQFLLNGASLNKPVRQLSHQNYEAGVSVVGSTDYFNYPAQFKLSYLVGR